MKNKNNVQKEYDKALAKKKDVPTWRNTLTLQDEFLRQRGIVTKKD
jgi:hypothetical protein